MRAFHPTTPVAAPSIPAAPPFAAHPFALLGLTARESEILIWLTEAKRDREIACILGVSPRTIHHHVANLLDKLHVETRTAAACLATQILLGHASPEAGAGAKNA